MSESAHDTTHHDSPAGSGHEAHGGHGGDHVPHVLPLRLYICTWLALIVLTGLTIAASYVDFGSGNVVIALLIATMKASTVAALFMHLWFDRKFHAIILTSSLVFLGIFISFTMFDTDGRGTTEAIEADRPATMAQPFQETRSEEAIKAAVRAQYGVPIPAAKGGEAAGAGAPTKSAPAEPKAP